MAKPKKEQTEKNTPDKTKIKRKRVNAQEYIQQLSRLNNLQGAILGNLQKELFG